MAAIAFLVPAIIFFVFRFELFPIFNSDATFVFAAQDIDLSTAFSYRFNNMNFRPLSVFLEMRIGYLYKAYGEQFHTIVVSIVALLNGLLSLLVYEICFNYSRSRSTSLLASLFCIHRLYHDAHKGASCAF